MPNLIYPYTPVQFEQVSPALIFNKLSLSINANHQPANYLDGINNTPFIIL